MSNHEYIRNLEAERDRLRQEAKTLTVAIERYADTLILDQSLDKTSPLQRAVVANDLRAFLNFAENGGLLVADEPYPEACPSCGFLTYTLVNTSLHMDAPDGAVLCTNCGKGWVHSTDERGLIR